MNTTNQSKAKPADVSRVREKYKTIIRGEFFPGRGFAKARLSVGRRAVADYTKVAACFEGIADVMLFYVETGTQFTVEYGDIDEASYLSASAQKSADVFHAAIGKGVGFAASF